MFGQYLIGRDHDLVPLTPTGFELPVGFIRSNGVKFNGGFVEADYLIHPWLMAIMRWDGVTSSADRINGIGADAGNPPPAPFLSPFHSARNRFTPGVQVLIHANIKASFEYQIRPQQIVYDPATGKPLTNPFRTNSAVAGLEWVY